jgi:hypothetical protein
MFLSNSEINNLKIAGSVLKKNVLNYNEVEEIKKIIKLAPEGKGGDGTNYPVNFSNFLSKCLKFEFKKIKNSFFLLNLKNKFNLDEAASNFFERKSNLTMIDGYYNKPGNKEILPWHSDQAYSGAKFVNKIASPDYFFLKFFFYLTNVGSKNGCTSYIPESHKITYAVRSCLYEKIIEYEPFWELRDLVNLISKENNKDKIISKLKSKNELDSFMDKANLILSNSENSTFDFQADPGDLLIFNECGIHKGSEPSLNERVALRYLYF